MESQEPVPLKPSPWNFSPFSIWLVTMTGMMAVAELTFIMRDAFTPSFVPTLLAGLAGGCWMAWRLGRKRGLLVRVWWSIFYTSLMIVTFLAVLFGMCAMSGIPM